MRSIAQKMLLTNGYLANNFEHNNIDELNDNRTNKR